MIFKHNTRFLAYGATLLFSRDRDPVPEQVDDTEKLADEEKRKRANAQTKRHKRKVYHKPAEKQVPAHLTRMFGG